MGLPKYILNLDEMASAMQDLEVTPGLTKVDMGKLEDILNDYLPRIIELLERSGGNVQFKSVDMSLHIPAVAFDFEKRIALKTDALLTGFTFAQSAYKPEDTISLFAGDLTLVDSIHLKELGEQREFPAACFVPAQQDVILQYHNQSGNSKMFWCDLDYIRIARPPQAGKE